VTDELSETIEQILFQNRIRALNRQKEAIKKILAEAHTMICWGFHSVEEIDEHLENAEKTLEGS
jgi:hypothetical protein